MILRYIPNAAVRGLAICLSFWLFFLLPCTAYADEAGEEQEEEETKETASDPANFLYEDVPEWPEAPEITSAGAVLMDADTGVILYGKNMDEPQFPASITKIMTCLIAAEECAMDEMVTFSHEAVFGIDRASSNVGMDEGQSITMEEAIYCIMLASANEVAAAVAEHISGSVEKFAEKMNERAEELGCTHTHFVNANGLPDEEHYVSPHDMALISQEFNRNETLRRIAGASLYQMEATPTQPDSFPMPNHHQMYPGKEYAYEYVTWGKTGYTIAAKGTLVTCAEKNGLNLICVVMRADPPGHYRDTKTLLDYGFSNFHYESPAKQETSYQVESDRNIFGMEQLFFINPADQVLIPNTLRLDMMERDLNLSTDDPEIAGFLVYRCKGYEIGRASIMIKPGGMEEFVFGSSIEDVRQNGSLGLFSEDDEIVYVNIKKILQISGIVFIVLILLAASIYVLKNYNFPGRRRRSIKKKNRRYHSEFDHFDF